MAFENSKAARQESPPNEDGFSIHSDSLFFESNKIEEATEQLFAMRVTVFLLLATIGESQGTKTAIPEPLQGGNASPTKASERTLQKKKKKSKSGKGKSIQDDGTCPQVAQAKSQKLKASTTKRGKGGGKSSDDALLDLTTTFFQDVTNEAIFGTGNTNGFWTCERSDSVELCLRAKQRYPMPQNPDGTYNNPDESFTVPTGDACAIASPPSGCWLRANWNWEWSINTDCRGTTGDKIFTCDF